MADKKKQALKRLVKKLSALRATLRRDERELLDQLVLGSAAEVQAHAMTNAASKGAKTPKPIEVSAHAMTNAAAPSSINEMIEFDAQAKVYRVKNP